MSLTRETIHERREIKQYLEWHYQIDDLRYTEVPGAMFNVGSYTLVVTCRDPLYKHTVTNTPALHGRILLAELLRLSATETFVPIWTSFASCTSQDGAIGPMSKTIVTTTTILAWALDELKARKVDFILHRDYWAEPTSVTPRKNSSATEHVDINSSDVQRSRELNSSSSLSGSQNPKNQQEYHGMGRFDYWLEFK